MLKSPQADWELYKSSAGVAGAANVEKIGDRISEDSRREDSGGRNAAARARVNFILQHSLAMGWFRGGLLNQRAAKRKE